MPRLPMTLAFATATLLAAGGAAQAQNCMEVLARTPDTSSFVNALSRTGVSNLLRGSPGPFTILAPTNQAVNRLPINLRNDVFGSPALTEGDMDPVTAPAVVNAHIIDGRHTAAEVRAGADTQTMVTRNGNELRLVRGADGRFSIEPQGRGRRAVQAHVVGGEIPCSNGIIYQVDAVLVRR
jgi:uncharacterized surface protein with fasciclin (FAS1) repeats